MTSNNEQQSYAYQDTRQERINKLAKDAVENAMKEAQPQNENPIPQAAKAATAVKGLKETMKEKWSALTTHEKVVAGGFILSGIAMLACRNKLNPKVLATIGYTAVSTYGTHLICEGMDIVFDKAIPQQEPTM